ncbi:hypothetical protein SY27_14200 [Flavobacterium sp. 316]|uniref:hypothetical protein n=1 Tax=Flavobacterium sp. 316 TaxID=1603293 RepID=UPI0005E272BE|nr:hypothetical protein [Flavobacterium sp. 316]KIX20279.1 hypothetical protein SY27_14200 [Flavobacterium sp. 316]
MKLIKKTALLLVFVSFFSCSNDEETTSLTNNDFNSLGMKSDGKLLIFKNIEDYEKVVNNPSEALQNEVLSEIAKMGHLTYAEVNPITTLDINTINTYISPYFSQLINKDNCIQIGSHIFKINKKNETVLVLEAKYANEYLDLIQENLSNSHIQIYSTDDDVLGLISNDEEAISNKACSEDAAGGRNQGVGLQIGGRLVTLYSIYEKSGIYCSAHYYMYSNATFSSTERAYIQTENTWTKAKCSSASGPSSLPWYSSPGHYGYEKTLPVYKSTKRLNGYHLKGRIRFESGSTTSYTTSFSTWAEIEANSPY